ncbi:hypothetical protein GGS26DRAFT_213869 [Hypomontagnella submonticulosa]|nr:hypothetical protein GGS26DRAFT_213869 [Hypomontagnella submonticulosa]
MPILLFCTALEAKPFIPEVLAVELSRDIELFALAESRTVEGDFKTELRDGESFTTDFIGASEEDCQTWALEQMKHHKSVESQLIAIADERLASDQTIIMQYYNEGPELEFPPYGTLPPENNKWYSFRIKYKDAFAFDAALSFGAFDVVFPTYFGRKDVLTDEQGIFDVQRAEKMSVSNDGIGETSE